MYCQRPKSRTDKFLVTKTVNASPVSMLPTRVKNATIPVYRNLIALLNLSQPRCSRLTSNACTLWGVFKGTYLVQRRYARIIKDKALYRFWTLSRIFVSYTLQQPSGWRIHSWIIVSQLTATVNHRGFQQVLSWFCAGFL